MEQRFKILVAGGVVYEVLTTQETPVSALDYYKFLMSQEQDAGLAVIGDNLVLDKRAIIAVEVAEGSRL